MNENRSKSSTPGGPARRLAVGLTAAQHKPDGHRRLLPDARPAQLRAVEAVLRHTLDLVWVTDAEGRITYVNPAFEARLGYRREECVGHRLSDLTQCEGHDREFYARSCKRLLRGEVVRLDCNPSTRGGHRLKLDELLWPIFDEQGRLAYLGANAREVPEQEHTQARLRRLAYYDVLTGLPNRYLFRERLEHAVLRAQRSGEGLAVLFIDLDGFKAVNDGDGHAVGDAVLCEVGRRLEATARQGDTPARLAGDEFVVLLEGLPPPNECVHGGALEASKRFLACLEHEILVEGKRFQLTPSIGVSHYPTDASSSEQLLKQADIAMYNAKRAGGNTFRFYNAL